MSGILNLDLTAEEKLVRARVQLQKEKPFFSYLTMHLNFIEDKEECPTMGVDAYGNMYYNPKFVDSLSDDEIKGAMAHEVMHCALEHLDRCNGREPELFNVSSDIVINGILITDGMTIPKNALIPRNNEFELFGVKLKKVNDKTSEEVYDKLWRGLSKQFKQMRNQIKKYLQDQNGKGIKGFDEHHYDKKGKKKDGDKQESNCGQCGGTGKHKKCNGSGCPDCGDTGKCPNCNGTGKVQTGKISKDNKDWKKILVDACSYARQRGSLPAGMERIVGKLLETYIDWRGLLYRYITNQIPIDYTWSRPSKRSHSLGYYIPSVEKEMIDVMVAVDTSGSISQHELAEFISEISSICRSFKNVALTVIDCD